ncbi:MAG: peptidase C1 [Parasporobacterium sp.]|nr:peptidase C1 [Parasporobacterium sp.]
MKKLTPFLFCLLVILVGAMFAFNFLGITEPVLYYAGIENQAVFSGIPVVTAEDFDSIELPDYYNCLDVGRINKTRDQGELGACWAFAANAALESRLLPAEQWDFSEDHMILNNGFYNNESEGGDFYMAVAYLSAWKGPVTEEEDPYNDGKTNPDAEVVKHIQEVQFLEDGDFESIKKMVYIYGAVESSIHISIDSEQYIDETYYNRYNYSYCYPEEGEANHEVVIIGWDDTYPASAFNVGAQQDGAFICLNSWGSEFGDNGVFYVSYDDCCIGQSAVVYSRVDDVMNYDHIYQNDEHGWVGRMGFEESSAYFANVYMASGNESLKAVGFYATGPETSYKVYVCRHVLSPTNLLSDRVIKAQGELSYAGYYTIDLDEEIPLNQGERFAVIVQIDTPGSLHPVAIEMDAGEGRTGTIDLVGKESFISENGRAWENTQKESGCNICLKAFTSN